MQDLINKITPDFESVTGQEVIKILSEISTIWSEGLINITNSKDIQNTNDRLNDIKNAIECLNCDGFIRLKRSRKYWNKIINERI